MVTSKESLFSDLAKQYSIGESDAAKLVAYDREFRKNLNGHELAAEMVSSGKFELKDGTASSFGKLLSDAVGIVPVAGQTLSFLGSLVSRGAKRFEENEQERLARKFEEVNPALDHQEWCQITKSVSEEVVKNKIKEIAALKSPQDVRSLADKDSEKVIRGILHREEGRSAEPKSLIQELSSIALGPDSITKPNSSRQSFPNIFSFAHDHQLSH